VGQGSLQIHDPNTKQKIDVIRMITARAPAEPGCGSIASGSPGSAEFNGVASVNGSGAYPLHGCVQDNAEPGKGLDRLHIDCAACPYNTSTSASSELLATGNVRVISTAAPVPPAAATS